jgi:hypothetical protein
MRDSKSSFLSPAPGYPLQFLGPGGACGISASIPCASLGFASLPVGGSAPSRRTACFTRLQPQCKTGQRSEQRERRRERPQGANIASPSAPPSCHPRSGDPRLAYARLSDEGKCLPLKLPLGAASHRRRSPSFALLPFIVIHPDIRPVPNGASFRSFRKLSAIAATADVR